MPSRCNSRARNSDSGRGQTRRAHVATQIVDSTLRSNLSVGLPIDLLIYERDSLEVRREKRIEQDDEYFRKLSSAWSEALRSSFAKIEEFKL